MMSEAEGSKEVSVSRPPRKPRSRRLSGSDKVRKLCLKEEKKIIRAIHESLIAISDCQKKECGHERHGKVKLPEFVGFLIHPNGEILRMMTGMWKQGERYDKVQEFEFDLMALWRMYINSLQPDDERNLEDYDVVLSDEGTLGQLIKSLKKEKVDAVKSLYMCQGMSDAEADERSRRELSGHPDYQSCQGDDGCSVCNNAREFLGWPSTVPYIYPSRLRIKDKKVVIEHYKIADPEIWEWIQGKSSVPMQDSVALGEMARGTDGITHPGNLRSLMERFLMGQENGARINEHAAGSQNPPSAADQDGSTLADEPAGSSAPQQILSASETIHRTEGTHKTSPKRPRKRGRPKKVRRGRPPKRLG